jgi:hypothetical protein
MRAPATPDAQNAAERRLLATGARSPAAYALAVQAGASQSIFTQPHRAAAWAELSRHYESHAVPPVLPAFELRLGQHAAAAKEIDVTPASPESDVADIVCELRADEDVRTRLVSLSLAEAAAKRGDTKRARRFLDEADELAAAIRGDTVQRAPRYQLLTESIAHAMRPVGQRLSTGFETLDEAVRGGIPLGRVVALLGAPGAGKTGLAVYLMCLWELAGCAVAYLAADEPAEGIITRIGQHDGCSRELLESEGSVGDVARAELAARSVGRGIIVIDPDADESMRTIEDAHAALVHFACDRQQTAMRPRAPRVSANASTRSWRCSRASRSGARWSCRSARWRVPGTVPAIGA